MSNLLDKYKSITEHELSELGIYLDTPEIIKNLDELRTYSLYNVIAENIVPFRFNNDSRMVEFHKSSKYVMDLNWYSHIYYKDKIRPFKPADIKFTDVYKPYLGHDLTNKALLVCGAGGFGDLLFLQPVLRYIKNKYPSCKLVLAYTYRYQSILKNWDNIVDEAISVPFDYDYMINSDYHVFFDGVITRNEQAKRENIYRLLSIWFGLDIPDKLLIPMLYPDEECINSCKKILNNWDLQEKSFIILQLVASSFNRIPRMSIWKKIIDILTEKGHNIIITDAPERAAFIDSVIKTLNNKDKVYNFAPYSTSILDTVALTSLAKLTISPDTGLIHIAESLGVKSFGIYGTFPGKIRLSTYKNCDWIDCKADCAPCFTHSSIPCENSIDKFPTCYDNLNINEAIKKIEKLLKE